MRVTLWTTTAFHLDTPILSPTPSLPALAGSGGEEVKQLGLGLSPLAGFEVTTEDGRGRWPVKPPKEAWEIDNSSAGGLF